MSDDFKEVEQLLRSWNLPQLCETFRDQEISMEVLEALTDADLEALIPKVGPRALFRKRLVELLNSKSNMELEIEDEVETLSEETADHIVVPIIYDEENSEMDVLSEVWLEEVNDDSLQGSQVDEHEVETVSSVEDAQDTVQKSSNIKISKVQLCESKKNNALKTPRRTENLGKKSSPIKMVLRTDQQKRENKNAAAKETEKTTSKFEVTLLSNNDDEDSDCEDDEDADIEENEEQPHTSSHRRHCQRIGRNYAGLNVEEIVQGSEAGRNIIEAYESNPVFDKRTRLYIADLIVTAIYAKNLIMDRYKFENIANQIVNLFPTEDKETWFITNKNSKKYSGGTLYYKYYSHYTKMRKTGFYKHYVDSVNKHFDSDASLSAEIENNCSAKLINLGNDPEKKALKRAIPKYERMRQSSDFIRIDLKELLESSYEGLGLLEYYEKHQGFDVQTRSRLCKIAVMEAIHRNIKMQPLNFYDMSCQIVELFPNEEFEVYFLPRGKTPPKGCLYHKYLYTLRRLRKIGLINKRSKETS